MYIKKVISNKNVLNAIYIGTLCSVAYLAVYFARNILGAVTPATVEGGYAIGLLWYSMLSGNDVKNNTFCDFDEEISEKEITIAKECVAQICGI